MLEALDHGDNSFVTLTYSDEYLPKDGSLNPRDTQLWLKRFRKEIAPQKVRYYLVGEYGDQTWRPHYHLALFGFPFQAEKIIRETWNMGHVLAGPLTTESAQYVCGYVTKKMVRFDDARLEGRHPEFCRMSLRPGIGAGAVHEIASELLKFGLEDTQADVPSALRHGRRLLPLGRYLRRRLREAVGKPPEAPQEVIDAQAEEVRDVYEAAKAAAPIGGEVRRLVYRDMLAAASDQKVLQMQARAKIFKGKRSL